MAPTLAKLLTNLVASLTALSQLLAPSATSTLPTAVLSHKNGTIIVELAETPEAQVQGLSDRATLAPNHGMLFVLPRDSQPPFWMKGMNFPLDFIWLNKDWQIRATKAHVATSTYPQSFAPLEPIRYVLEVPAGYTQKYELKIGDFITREL